jgi:hypothetical protein
VRNFSDKEKYLRAYEQLREQKGTPQYMSVFPIPNHKYEVILDPANDRGLIGHITSGRIKHHGKPLKAWIEILPRRVLYIARHASVDDQCFLFWVLWLLPQL